MRTSHYLVCNYQRSDPATCVWCDRYEPMFYAIELQNTIKRLEADIDYLNEYGGHWYQNMRLGKEKAGYISRQNRDAAADLVVLIDAAKRLIHTMDDT